MHHNCGHGRKKFDHIISVRYGIHTVSGRSVKAQQLCSIKSVQRISGSCKRTCSKRTGIHTFTNISHTASVPAEHLKICPYMMCQCNRLCFLQMRKSRHICVHIILHDHLKSFQKFLQFCINLRSHHAHTISYQERPGHYDFFLYEASCPDLPIRSIRFASTKL